MPRIFDICGISPSTGRICEEVIFGNGGYMVRHRGLENLLDSTGSVHREL